MNETHITFTAGQTYAGRYIGDSELAEVYTITRRTAKFVTLENSDGKTKRVGIRVRDGVEYARWNVGITAESPLIDMGDPAQWGLGA